MIVSEINKNVFAVFEDNQYDALIHGANCFHTMGAGVAAVVSYRYPDAYKADKETPYGEKNKLGLYSKATTTFGDVINLYTQFDCGTDKMHVDYDAIARGFALLNEDYKGNRVCIPRIGAGLAGGDWNVIKKLINDNSPDLHIDVYYI